MTNVRIALWIVVIAAVVFWALVGVAGIVSLPTSWGFVAHWATTALVVIVLLALAGKEINQQWFGVLIDNRNKYSLARLQISLWTVMVMSAYIVIALTRIAAMERGELTQAQALEIAFPPELLLAMGISAASFAGSSLIKSTKSTKTITIGAKSTPESAEQRKEEAKTALDAAEAALAAKVQADVDAAKAVTTAQTAVTAAATAAKPAAEEQLARAQMLATNATQDKNAAIKDRDEKKKALETAEKDHTAITEAQGRLHRNADPSEASWVDFFRGEEISNYKLVDMSKVQMMFFTVVVIAAYVASIAVMLKGNGLLAKDGTSFPPFGDTLNALLGISHGTYLSVKAMDHG